MSRCRRGPLPGHLGGAARPAPASGLGGEQPPGAAERDSPRRRRRRSWRCCCSCGARPGFGSSGSLPRRAAASLFLAPPPLPPPPLPPPLRPRRGARGRRARDGRRLPQAGLGLRLRRPRRARRGQQGPGHPPLRPLRLPACPGGRHPPSAGPPASQRPAGVAGPLLPFPSLRRLWAPIPRARRRPPAPSSVASSETRGGRRGAALGGGKGQGLVKPDRLPPSPPRPAPLPCSAAPRGHGSSAIKFRGTCSPRLPHPALFRPGASPRWYRAAGGGSPDTPPQAAPRPGQGRRARAAGAGAPPGGAGDGRSPAGPTPGRGGRSSPLRFVSPSTSLGATPLCQKSHDFCL